MTTPKSHNASASTQPDGQQAPRADLDDLRSLIKDMTSQIGARLADLEGRVAAPVPSPSAHHQSGPASPTTASAAVIPSYVNTPAQDAGTEGWDAATAEALTQIYEGRPPQPAGSATPAQKPIFQPQVFYVEGAVEDAVVAPRPGPQVQSTSARTSTRTSADVVLDAAPVPQTALPLAAASILPVAAHGQDGSALALDSLLQRLSEDRTWLDGRLQELSARVDANIEQSSSAVGLDALNARLMSLEEHLTPALGTLVTRADLANMADMGAITALERQLDSLATAISETRHDLTRLDAIEATLNDLASYAAEARAYDDQAPTDTTAQNFAQTPQASAPPIQIDALAEATAHRVAEQMAQLRPEATDRIAHLHDLVQELMVERKRNDEQVATTLDTLQDALVRLIERVEGYDEQAFDDTTVAPDQIHQPHPAPIEPHPQPDHAASAYEPHAAPGGSRLPHSIAPVEPPVEPQGQAHDEPPRFGTAKARSFDPQPVETVSAEEALARRAPPHDRQEEQAGESPPAGRATPRGAQPIAPRVAQPAQPAHRHDFEELAKSARGTKSPRGSVRMTVSSEDEQAPQNDDAQASLMTRKRPIIQVVAAAVSCIALSYFAYLFLNDRSPTAAMMRTDQPSNVRLSQPATQPPRESVKQSRPLMPDQPQTPQRDGMEPPGLLPPQRDDPILPTTASPTEPLTRELAPVAPQPPAPPAVQPMPRQQPQPQSALPRPAEPRAEIPIVPSTPAQPQQRRPRSQPETVTDELSDGTDTVAPAPNRIATASVVPKIQTPAPQTPQPPMVSGPQGMPGLAIQSTPMRPEDIYAAQQRRLLAARSQSSAERAFEPPQQPALPQAPVAKRIPVQPSSAAPAPGHTVQGLTPAKAQPDPRLKSDDLLPVGTPSNGIVPLPPAAIGPTSLRSAAAQGDPAAQFEVAARFAEGRGIKQDFRQAHDWYQRAATKGHVPSQYRLGTLFERGLGVPADPARARAWYKRAAEQGNIKAMHNLAVMSANTEGQNPDYATAAQWFVEAAYRGLSDSQFNLAVLHENGLGVRKDQVEAAKWYALAARGGDPEATKRRDALRAKLSAADNARLEQTITGFKRKPVNQKANEAKVAGLISVTPRR